MPTLHVQTPEFLVSTAGSTIILVLKGSSFMVCTSEILAFSSTYLLDWLSMLSGELVSYAMSASAMRTASRLISNLGNDRSYLAQTRPTRRVQHRQTRVQLLPYLSGLLPGYLKREHVFIDVICAHGIHRSSAAACELYISALPIMARCLRLRLWHFTLRRR